MKIAVLIRQDYNGDTDDPIEEVEVFPTKKEAIEYVKKFYFDDENVDEEFWSDAFKTLNAKNYFVDTDSDNPIQWDIYERTL